MQTQEAPRTVESVTAAGNQVIETIKNLIHEGNVRRISIKQEGRTIAEFPLTFGVVGAALAPVLAAAGAIAALVTDCTIEVQRDDEIGTLSRSFNSMITEWGDARQRQITQRHARGASVDARPRSLIRESHRRPR